MGTTHGGAGAGDLSHCGHRAVPEDVSLAAPGRGLISTDCRDRVTAQARLRPPCLVELLGRSLPTGTDSDPDTSREPVSRPARRARRDTRRVATIEPQPSRSWSSRASTTIATMVDSTPAMTPAADRARLTCAPIRPAASRPAPTTNCCDPGSIRATTMAMPAPVQTQADATGTAASSPSGSAARTLDSSPTRAPLSPGLSSTPCPDSPGRAPTPAGARRPREHHSRARKQDPCQSG